MFGMKKMDSFEAQSMALLVAAVHGLVEYEDDVKINHIQTADSNSHLFEVTVHKEDIGKIIGKKGKTVSCIRTVLNNISHKHRTTSVLEIIE